MSADGAFVRIDAEVTSRTARWTLAPSPGEPQQLRATCRPTHVLPQLRVLDDALARFHCIIAADAAGNAIEAQDWVEALHLVREELRVWNVTPTGEMDGVLRELESAVAIDTAERQRLWRRALPKLHRMRPAIRRAQLDVRLRDELVPVLRRVERDVGIELAAAGVPVPAPRRLHDTLVYLLRYAESRRRLGASSWSDAVDEREFHRSLHEFLVSTADEVEHEVETGAGRVDFMLLGTPVEVKARRLGTKPAHTVRRHLQQAADYASNRGLGVGVLLVLDLTEPKRRQRHQPHLDDEVRVFQVPARPSIRSGEGTVVVTIVVTAWPAASSILGG